MTIRNIDGAAEILVADSATTTLDPARIFARRGVSRTGHGIGLALALSLAEAEGGRLTLVGSEPTTTFSLLLATGPTSFGPVP